jgi:hypothetical protein
VETEGQLRPSAPDPGLKPPVRAFLLNGGTNHWAKIFLNDFDAGTVFDPESSAAK